MQPVNERDGGACFTKRHGVQPKDGWLHRFRVAAVTFAYVLTIFGLAPTAPQ